MTPCQELGYKVGDKFVALEGSLFTVGSTVTLYRDDGTSVPLFAGEGSGFDNAGGMPGAYEYLDCVEPIKGE